MAISGPGIGTIFVELDLDPSKYKGKMRQILSESTTTSLDIEKNWRILGGRSAQHFDALRARAENAFNAIKANAMSSGRSQKMVVQEILRAENHKNDIIKRLNQEQFESEEALGKKRSRMSRDSQAGWLSMMKGMIAYRVILEGIQLVQQATIGSLKDGIKAIDDFKMAQASMAAAIASSDPSIPFDKAFKTAEGLNKEIEVLDRQFIGTAEELRILADSMLTFGMGIDLSNQKAKEQFVAFGNTIKLLTRGQDFQRQAMQEVRALMEGSNVQGALLVKKINAAGYDAKKMIPIWKEQGVLMEKINEIFGGYAQAGSEIEKTWTAQKGTMTTIYQKVLREGFGPAYEDIVGWVTKWNNSMLGVNGLTEKGWSIVEGIRTAWEAVKMVLVGVGATIELFVVEPFRMAYGFVKDILEGLDEIAKRRTGPDLGIDPMGIHTGGTDFNQARSTPPGWKPESLEDERDRYAARGGLKVEPGKDKLSDEASKKEIERQKKLDQLFVKSMKDRTDALEDFYGDYDKLAMMSADQQIKAFEERSRKRKDLEKSFTDFAREEAMRYDEGWADGIDNVMNKSADAFEIMKANFKGLYEGGYAAAAMEVWDSGLGAATINLEEAQSQIDAYVQIWMDANKSIKQVALDIGMSLYNSIGGALADIVTGVKSAADAFKEMGLSIVKMIIQSVVQWVISNTIVRAMSSAFKVAETAATSAMAAILEEAWRPAAYFASVATLGGAAAEGAAALGIGLGAVAAMTAGTKAVAGLGDVVTGGVHGGMDYVPKESTYLLDKGERVLSPEQNQDWTEFIEGKGVGQTIQLILDGKVLASWFHDAAREGTIQLRPA